MQDQKALMDSLMGGDRNAGKRDEKRNNAWRDNAICKNDLVWECPCEYFINESGRVAPKSPFGECCKQHSEAMKIRFKEDKDYRKFKHRYLSDLEAQLQPKIKAMDEKIATEKEALILKVEAGKDKLEAAGKLQMDDTNNSDSVGANEGRARRKDDKPDEICEVCGTYSAFTGALIMRHEAGILHIGWGRLRESLSNLKKELKASKEGLTSDELLGPTEARERSRSIDVRKNRDQRRDHRDGRKDNDEPRDRDRDRDMRREYDQKGRARERDTHSDREYDQKSRRRERDTNSERGRDRYDDRRCDARDRDRGKGRRQGDESGRGKRGSSRKEEDVDEFGRAKTIHEYRSPIREEDKRGADNRSQSRDARKSTGSDKRSQSRDARKSTGSLIQDTQDCKILRIELSEDWQEVMNQQCQELKLVMSEWDMTCIDCKDNALDLEAKALSVDSFPLRFKFTRKE